MLKNKKNGDEDHGQMPADFLIDASSGEVLAGMSMVNLSVKYGERFFDRWTAEEVIQIKKELFEGKRILEVYGSN